MHRHGTQQSASGCSLFCASNYRDKAYYGKHGHCQDEAPVTGCFACEEQRRRAEDKRREQECRASAASKCLAMGENPAHWNSHLRLGLERHHG